MPDRTRQCTQCQHLKPMAAFRLAGREHRSLRCIDCRRSFVAGLKRRVTCGKCRQKLPREQFTCAPDGRRTTPYCHACAPLVQATRERQARREPLLSRNPCPNCERYFRLEGHNVRASKVRYCSNECLQEMKLYRRKRCLNCGLQKPLHDFDRYHSSLRRKGGHLGRCRECYAAARATTTHRRQLWTTPKAICRAMQIHGRRHGHGDADLALAKWVMRQSCWLCGSPARTARLKNPALPWSQANTHPLCNLCSRYVQHTGVDVLLVQANRIAALRPLSPGAPAPSGEA